MGPWAVNDGRVESVVACRHVYAVESWLSAFDRSSAFCFLLSLGTVHRCRGHGIVRSSQTPELGILEAMDRRRICDGSEELRQLKERLHMAKAGGFGGGDAETGD